MVACLNSRLGNNDLRYKKHHFVCYFFETIQELCLAPDNVSSSLDLESFIIIKINSSFGVEWIEENLGQDDLQLAEVGIDYDGDVVMIV